jgi:hypothetical protein
VEFIYCYTKTHSNTMPFGSKMITKNGNERVLSVNLHH